MKDLAIARALDDDTRKSGIWMRNANGEVEVYSLHITDHGEAIITDNSDYTKIYAVFSLDFWNAYA